MKGLTRLVKRAALGVLSFGTSAFIAACYGVYMVEGPNELAEGRVTDGGQGVRGLQLCAVLPGGAYAGAACDETDLDGYYGVGGDDGFVQAAYDDGFQLVLHDIDGELNGSYDDQLIEIPAGTPQPVSEDFDLTGLGGDDDDSAGDDDDSAI